MFIVRIYQLILDKQPPMTSPDNYSARQLSWRPDCFFTHINSSGKINMNAGYA